jgi:hypothetical protein
MDWNLQEKDNHMAHNILKYDDYSRMEEETLQSSRWLTSLVEDWILPIELTN